MFLEAKISVSITPSLSISRAVLEKCSLYIPEDSGFLFSSTSKGISKFSSSITRALYEHQI